VADKTVTVKSSGGDYTSLNAALAGESANLVTNTRILTIECYSMSDTANAVTGTGYTTSSSYYIKILTPTAERHDGKWNSGKYRLEASGNWASLLYIQADYTSVKGLQFARTGTGSGSSYILSIYANNCTIAYNIVRQASGTSLVGGIYLRSASWGSAYFHTCYNNLVYDCDVGIYPYYTIETLIYNNTVVDCTTGILDDVGGDYASIFKNNLCAENTTDFDIDASSSSFTYNASSDDTADDQGGTGNRIGQAFTFASYGGDDFHLASGDAGAKDYGVSDPGSGLFSDDIDGVARSGSWDIGADEYVAGGGGSGRLDAKWLNFNARGKAWTHFWQDTPVAGSGPLTKTLDDTVTLSDSLLRTAYLAKADTVTLSDVIVRGYGLGKADTLTLSDALAKSFGTAKADTITLSDAILKAAGLSKSDTITLSDGMTKIPGLSRTDIVTLSDAVAKALSITKADTVTLSDICTAVITLLLSFGDTVTLSDGMTKIPGLSRTDTVTLSDALTKAVAMVRADTVTLSDYLTAIITLVLALADTLTLSDAAVRTVGMARTDTVTLTDSAVKRALLAKTDTITLSDVLARAAYLAKADTVTLSDAISRAAYITKDDLVTLTDALAKNAGMTVADIIALTDAFYYSMAAMELDLSDTVTLTDFISLVFLALELGDTIDAREFTDIAAARSFTDTIDAREFTDIAAKRSFTDTADAREFTDTAPRSRLH
jgi:parallel beta-helix repeat protein